MLNVLRTWKLIFASSALFNSLTRPLYSQTSLRILEFSMKKKRFLSTNQASPVYSPTPIHVTANYIKYNISDDAPLSGIVNYTVLHFT